MSGGGIRTDIGQSYPNASTYSNLEKVSWGSTAVRPVLTIIRLSSNVRGPYLPQRPGKSYPRVGAVSLFSLKLNRSPCIFRYFVSGACIVWCFRLWDIQAVAATGYWEGGPG